MICDKATAIYFQTLSTCKDLLEEELRLAFPMWKKSHDFGAIIVFETVREYRLEEISELSLSFALGKGIFLGLSNAHGLEETTQKACEHYETSNVHRWDLSGSEHQMGDRKARANVIDTFKINEDQYLIAARYQVRGDFAPFSGSSPIPVNKKAPGLDYLGLAEAFKRFRPLVAHDEVFLDIKGAHKPGRAYYLLEKGFRVIGVDQDKPSDLLGSEFKDYLHLDEDIFSLTVKDLQGLPPVDWIVTYLNLHEDNLLAHLMKILDDHDEARGFMLTIKIENLDDVARLRTLKESFKESSYTHVKTGLTPSLQRECFVLVTAEQ